MTHIRGTPRHPQTEGKIKGWHQILKSRILLEHYNHARAHKNLRNLTPADICFGRGKAILAERERIKHQTLTSRRLQRHARAA